MDMAEETATLKMSEYARLATEDSSLLIPPRKLIMYVPDIDSY